MRARLKAAVGVRSDAGTGRVQQSRVGLLAVALVVTAVVVLAAPALAGAATTLSVDAAAGPPSYNATGVTIPAGEYVTVTATGTWTVNDLNPSRTSDANGIPGFYNTGFLDPTAPAGELIGSLDGGSTWFAIGAGPTNVDGPGTLILSTNDFSTNFGDNAGSLSVSISDPIGPQTVTFLGAATGGGPLAIQDANVEWYNPATQAWQPAYDDGTHPWGEITGTGSWIDCGPSLYYCTGTSTTNTYTAKYRMRFNIPADWSNPTMTLTMNADNEASVSLNGQTIISDFVGGPGGKTATVTPPLQTGVNELDFTVIDWGGIAGFNYRADLQVEAPSPPAALAGCQPGTYSSTGAQPCTDAPAGTYVSTGWATSATPCAPGTYSSNAGSVACDPAPADTYVAHEGADAPTPCPDGSTTNGLTGQIACVAIPPTITLQSIDPAPNANGWNNGPVTVTWACTNSETATVTVVLSGEDANQSATGTCVNPFDNTVTASDTQTGINIDLTPPTVTYAGATTYTVADTVSIACTPYDALSGIDTTATTCESASGPAWSFGVGSTSLPWTAADKAGNTASGSASFTVTVDAESLCALVKEFVSNHGIANSLCVKLDAAAAAGARGQAKTKANDLAAFDHEVSAQTGKALTEQEASALVGFAGAL